MKTHPNTLTRARHKFPGGKLATALLASLIANISPTAPDAFASPVPNHGITAANLDVVVNSFDNDTNSVTVTAPYAIGDLRVPYANNGDYDIQIGPERTNDVLEGLLISSVRENGRDNGNLIYQGVQIATTHIDYHRPGSTNGFGEAIDNSYWIPIATTQPNSLGTQIREWDINLAAAWFPYNKWIGGFVRNSTGANGGDLDLLTGSEGLVVGTHFVDRFTGNGKAKVDLTSLGIDSRTDGILLVMGAKNEDNYGLSKVNTDDGTWTLYSKDNGSPDAGTEQDPLAFVFIPKTNTDVISGRFLGNGTIDMFSGATPAFTVATVDVGTWELKIPGASPRFGVLILSPEGGLPGNQDNAVTYQVNDAGDGWIIKSWDLPSPVNGDGSSFPPFFAPPLETPGDGTEPVADFVFISGATPGVTVTPVNNLFTTEGGTTADISVVLDTPPTADVTINVSSDNIAEGTVSTSTLTFTPANWNVPQTITVTGQDDATEDGPITYHVVLAAATSADADYNGVNAADATVKNLDNESPFTVVPSSGLVTTEAGGTATFDVILNSAPTADVVIGLSSSDPSEGTVSAPSLTFTTSNWNQVQTVTITGVDDPADDGDIAYSIITANAVSSDATFNGRSVTDVSVVNVDNDSVGLVLNTDSTGVSVKEGHVASYTVALSSQPSADVTVDVAASDTTDGGTVSPSTLTFTPANWNTPQSVTITAIDDLVADGDTAWAITNTVTSADSSYAGLASVVLMTTLDNDPILTNAENVAFYGIGTDPVGIAGGATISDPNADSYNGATLKVELTANGSSDDHLAIRSVGTEAGQVSVSGNTVSYGGTAIGSFSGGVGTALMVMFNGAATPESAQAVARSVTFENTNSSPSLANRTATITFTHADTASANMITEIRVGPFRLADFQEGADHGYGVYTGEADIEIFENFADVPYPAGHSGSTNDPRMWIDARAQFTTEEAQVLMRFDNIIGTGPGQIPPGATIVSAELILNVIDTGHGSPLFRMLKPWDEQNATWLSFNGVGIQINDVDARSTFDSQFGVQSVNGTTQTGEVSIGVTADVQAWANGETNYGWGMVSWDQDLNPNWNRGNNGLAFRPSEAPMVEERPRLKVIWVPAGTPVASFRQNVNGYASAKDTRIREDAPDEDASAAVAIAVDFTGAHDEVLMRFDDIIGTNPGQIPPNAHINAAFLDLASLGGAAPGDGGQFFAMLTPWDDTATWNSIGGSIQTNGIQAATTASTVAGNPSGTPNVCGGYMSFDVTPDVQSWANGSVNYGWAILPWDGLGDGWSFSTAEAVDERARPRLRIYYTPGAAPVEIRSVDHNSTSVTIQFGGEVGTTYSIRRSGTVDGTYNVIGTATVQGDGTANFVDNSPLAGSGFYRISNP